MGIGKILPLDKLVTEISKGVGRLTKSYFDKKDVDTQAYRIRTLASANMDALELISNKNEPKLGLKSFKTEGDNLKITAVPLPKIINLPDEDLIKRTEDRALFRELKKQQNLESITAIAAEQLKDEPTVDNTPVDETWLNRFMNTVEEVSEEELQNLWGRILAGEVKRPNSYSLRTLDVIKNLNRAEARIITKIATYSFNVANLTGILNDPKGLIDIGVNWMDEINILREIGILRQDSLDKIKFSNVPNNQVLIIDSGDKVLKVVKSGGAPYPDIPFVPYTKIGTEILTLIDYEPNINNLKLIAGKIKYGNSNVNVLMSKKIKTEKHGTRYEGNEPF